MRTDFLVIGSGIAGLNFALLAARHGKVVVATKSKATDCATIKAQGGISAVIDGKDSFESHIKDTLEAGRGICDEGAVRIMVESAPHAIQRLKELGVPFDGNEDGISLGIEGGHSERRILHVKDRSGEAIQKALLENTAKEKNVEILEGWMAIDLIMDNGKCLGALFINSDGSIFPVFAKATILATGGAGMVFQVTANPKTATGDGVAIAFRAGAQIKDMEFMQFHPTTLNIPYAHFLLSESLRGEGALLINCRGERFMEGKCPKAELAPRDVVTLAIAKEMQKGPVYLDMTRLEPDSVKKRFPCIYARCLEHGVDITKEKIPITPAAHFMCGGVRTDLNGKTSIPNLYAIGEVACTGVHGANRLASNSLLEGMVFSERAAQDATGRLDNGIEEINVELPGITSSSGKELRKRIRTLMWDDVGIIRNKESMEKALEELNGINEEIDKLCSQGINPELLEARNMAIVSKLITEAALKRKESLGCHHIT